MREKKASAMRTLVRENNPDEVRNLRVLGREEVRDVAYVGIFVCLLLSHITRSETL
jgi:hypothetical protein